MLSKIDPDGRKKHILYCVWIPLSGTTTSTDPILVSNLPENYLPIYSYIEKIYKIVIFIRKHFFPDTGVADFSEKLITNFHIYIFFTRLISQDVIRMQHLGVARFSFGSVIGRACL